LDKYNAVILVIVRYFKCIWYRNTNTVIFDILDVKIYYFLGGGFYVSKKGGIYMSASDQENVIYNYMQNLLELLD